MCRVDLWAMRADEYVYLKPRGSLLPGGGTLAGVVLHVLLGTLEDL